MSVCSGIQSSLSCRRNFRFLVLQNDQPWLALPCVYGHHTISLLIFQWASGTLEYAGSAYFCHSTVSAQTVVCLWPQTVFLLLPRSFLGRPCAGLHCPSRHKASTAIFRTSITASRLLGLTEVHGEASLFQDEMGFGSQDLDTFILSTLSHK